MEKSLGPFHLERYALTAAYIGWAGSSVITRHLHNCVCLAIISFCIINMYFATQESPARLVSFSSDNASFLFFFFIPSPFNEFRSFQLHALLQLHQLETWHCRTKTPGGSRDNLQKRLLLTSASHDSM